MGEGGRRTRTRSQGRAAVIATAPPLPPLAPLPVEAPPPQDRVALLHHLHRLRPRHPTAAAEVAAETASARGGRQIGAGRKEKREVIAREEGVAVEGETQKDQRRGGRGEVMKGGAGRPGVIGSIKIETGRTRGANLVLIQPPNGNTGKHGGKQTIYFVRHKITKVFKITCP